MAAETIKEWRTTEEICAEFAVGEEKLLRFSARGNLPSRVDDEGRPVFRLDRVETLFVRRDDLALAPRLGAPSSALGRVRLGASPPAPLHAPKLRGTSQSRG